MLAGLDDINSERDVNAYWMMFRALKMLRSYRCGQYWQEESCVFVLKSEDIAHWVTFRAVEHVITCFHFLRPFHYRTVEYGMAWHCMVCHGMAWNSVINGVRYLFPCRQADVGAHVEEDRHVIRSDQHTHCLASIFLTYVCYALNVLCVMCQSLLHVVKDR